MLRYAIRLSGITGIALMKLDVLDGLDTVKICTHYECDGQKVETFPCSLKKLAACKPVYLELPGWKCDTSKARSFDELPAEARKFIQAIEEYTGVPAKLIAVGPKREQTIIREELF